MHEKYAKDGLVILSVSTDVIDEDNPRDQVVNNVRKFLKSFKAPFGAMILDEPSSLHQEKLHFSAAPSAFVFNRQGKWTQFKGDTNEFKPDKIEKLVVELLKEK
jgi:hypothetical protein